MKYREWEYVTKIEKFDEDILNKFQKSSMYSSLCVISSLIAQYITYGIKQCSEGTTLYNVGLISSIAYTAVAIYCLIETFIKHYEAKQLQNEKEEYKKSYKM